MDSFYFNCRPIHLDMLDFGILESCVQPSSMNLIISYHLPTVTTSVRFTVLADLDLHANSFEFRLGCGSDLLDSAFIPSFKVHDHLYGRSLKTQRSYCNTVKQLI